MGDQQGALPRQANGFPQRSEPSGSAGARLTRLARLCEAIGSHAVGTPGPAQQWQVQLSFPSPQAAADFVKAIEELRRL